MFVEYAKSDTEDILVRITAFNRGPDARPLHVLPTLWFRNTWSWGGRGGDERPAMHCSGTDRTPSTRATRRSGITA